MSQLWTIAFTASCVGLVNYRIRGYTREAICKIDHYRFALGLISLKCERGFVVKIVHQQLRKWSRTHAYLT